ncbi:MAG: radical SAM protein, partial [Pseudanabaenaceae cyanobacterium]
MVSTVAYPSFAEKVGQPLAKRSIRVLQVNVGRRCNQACTHCHVEAGPHRTETMSPGVTAQVVAAIRQFPQIATVDLTGGAPELHEAFRPLVRAAREAGKETIVRSNLTVYFVPGCEDIPEFCAQWGVRIVASLPCYLEDGVERQRGRGTYEASIRALQHLNALGYGDTLPLDR